MGERPPETTPSLKRRAFFGSATALAGFSVTQAIRLASNLIMTRLLAPEAFGLMAIAVAVNMWISMLTDFGVKASIIRSNNANDPAFLATAWMTQVVRGAVIALGIVAIAGVLWLFQKDGALPPDKIYSDPRLIVFLLGIAFSVFLTGLRSIKATLAERDMKLQRVVALEISGQLVAIFVSIAFAARGAGAYSLIYGIVAAAPFIAIGSFVAFSGPKSRLGFHKTYFLEIFNYGKWLLLASLFGFVINRGNQVIFGALMTKLAFSFLAIATIWINAAEAVVTTVMQRIAYPAFSEIHRTRPANIEKAYRSFRLLADIACVAIFVSIVLFADAALAILYTEGYATNIAPFMKLLAVTILFLPYNLLNTVMLAAGDSKRFTTVVFAPAIALIALTPPVFGQFGETAAILFAAGIRALSLPLMWRYANRVMRVDYRRELIPLIIAFGFIFAALATDTIV